jgi:CubicO group peptidase (beta-lactamase class C family)
MSMQFTAAAFLRLVELGKFQLDGTIDSVAPNVTNAHSITFRELLEERSGIADINNVNDYPQILEEHQTPPSLVARIAHLPATRMPGTPYVSEEHSAYNILALAIEKATGKPFPDAVRELLFDSAGLAATSEDFDQRFDNNDARGYEPVGTYDLKTASAIHWSAKSGNGSTVTTIEDEARWIHLLFSSQFLSGSSLTAMFDRTNGVGYGWFKRDSARFNEPAYYMNGRAPGFSSFVLYLPREDLAVIALSNIYSSATTQIGNDIAAIVLDRNYDPFTPLSMPPSQAELAACTGVFQFPADFFQPNGQLAVMTTGTDLELRWSGDGSLSPLIPVGKDHFIDRAYWENVVIERGPSGEPAALLYDRFRGTASTAKEHRAVQ